MRGDGPGRSSRSGGISTLEDIVALREMVELGVEGAIIGTALYVGRFTIEEALVAGAARTAPQRANHA